MLFRSNSHTEPWKEFVPDFDSMFTTPPVTTPYCSIIDMGGDLELLHSVDDGKESVNCAAQIGIDDAVHQIVGFAVLLSEE